MECSSPVLPSIHVQTLPPEQSSRKQTAEESGLFQTFVKAIGDSLPDPQLANPAPKKIETISHPSGKYAARKLIQSLSTQQDEFTSAIKVYKKFTSLLPISCLKGEELPKKISDFFDTLLSLVPVSASSKPDLFSYKSAKQIQQAIRFCSAELQLVHSSISINRFLMEIENKVKKIREELKYLPPLLPYTYSSTQPCLPPIESLPLKRLFGHLVPSTDVSQMKKAFLSLALNVVKKRLQNLTIKERSEHFGELIDIISFIHEAEDHEFAPTPSLEDRLSELEKNVSTTNPQILQSLRNKISSFMNGEIEVPINACVTELVDYVEEQERVLEEELCHIEKGIAEKQADACEKNLSIDLSLLQTGFNCDVDKISFVFNSCFASMIRPPYNLEYQFKINLNIYTIKMRQVRDDIQVLFREMIRGGNSTRIFKAAHLAGPRFCPGQMPIKIFAYKKINELRDLREKIGAEKRELVLARVYQKEEDIIQNLEYHLSQYQEEYAKALQDLGKEVKISREVPDAVRMWMVRKLKDPTQPKGLVMEYIDKISLDSLCHMAPPEDIKQQLKINTEVALLLCQAVERMHEAGYVHLTLCPEHFLIEKKQDAFAVKLIHFKMSVPEGSLGSRRIGDFLCPPELDTFKPDELFIAHAAIDNWALGFILIKIFYGYKIAGEFEDILYKFLHPDESDLPYYQKILRGIYSQFNPALTPWENSEILVHNFLGKYPVIDDVILHLLHPDPGFRWTAAQAADRLQPK